MYTKRIKKEDIDFFHDVIVKSISEEEFPFENKYKFTHFYKVILAHNEDLKLMYIVRKSKKEYCVYYNNGKFWSGYGTSFKDAILKSIKCSIYYTY